MLTMTYQIPLPDAAAVSTVRLRAKTKGPLCDHLPGLVFKLFLVDPENPCYATFYLWNREEGAVSFLKGPMFAGLVATFGRPEVRLALPLLVGTGRFPSEIWEVRGGPSDSEAFCAYYDPRMDEDVTYATVPGRGRRFEVMYVAQGEAATAR